ncbi:MAG: hypothetical protein LC624_09490, partial [Halobacteriales archaeon]|nr:hypothetical protein [Halobacteriales archaeon]
MARSPRVAALVALFLMSFPPIAQELVGLDLGASAQNTTPVNALLPNGVGWQNWPHPVELNLHFPTEADGTPKTQNVCPLDPATQTLANPGDKLCQLPMNTTIDPDTSVPATSVPRAPVNVPNNTPPTNPPAAQTLFARLAPTVGLAQPMTVESLGADMYITFTGQLLACGGGGNPIGLLVIVHALPSGDAQGEGSTIATGYRGDQCPAGRDLLPTGQPPYHLSLTSSDFTFTSPNPRLDAGQLLRADVVVTTQGEQSAAGSWSLQFDSRNAPSHLTVNSPDAVQYAVWTTDARDERKYTTTFPIPVDPATRFSTEGWFALKDSWGAYDVPPVEDSTCEVAGCSRSGPNDALWAMKILAPNGHPVVLSDPAIAPDGHEFRPCDGQTANSDDTVTCVIKHTNTDDNSAVVYRMPTRVGSGTTPGVSNVWNYTRARVTQIAPCPDNPQQPCGGQFTLSITGRMHKSAIESVIRDTVKFNLGGFGLRMGLLSLPNGASEQATHTVV